MADSQISFYLSGKRTPSLDTLVDLARTLKVSADWLLGQVPPEQVSADDRLRLARLLLSSDLSGKVEIMEALLTDATFLPAAELAFEGYRRVLAPVKKGKSPSSQKS